RRVGQPQISIPERRDPPQRAYLEEPVRLVEGRLRYQFMFYLLLGKLNTDLAYIRRQDGAVEGQGHRRAPSVDFSHRTGLSCARPDRLPPAPAPLRSGPYPALPAPSGQPPARPGSEDGGRPPVDRHAPPPPACSGRRRLSRIAAWLPGACQ